jgi:hypothetical protein
MINRMSFYNGLYKTRRQLNAGIDRPEAIESFPESHPRGFIKRFRKRRISIVESYVKIIGFLESDKCVQRLEALKLLTEHISYSRALKMPLNTARVQMALMKEAIKNRDDKRAQLELLRDFSICSFGNPRRIQKYLNELGIIEVPETGHPLKDLEMGWDLHVHDNSSYGRKTPTQLVIDAFIKGLSELTVVYNTLSHIEIINEVIEAGRLLGISVNLGLEFSVGDKEAPFHYIFLFPHFDDVRKYVDFLEHHKERFSNFLDGIERNQECRVQAINDIVNHFNTTFLPKINDGFQADSIYDLPALKLSDVDAVVPLKHATSMHLGEALFARFQPVLFKRVMYLKAQKKYADSRFKDNQMAEWEYLNIQKQYQKAREAYRALNPEMLRSNYFSSSGAFEPSTVFSRLEDIFKGEIFVDRESDTVFRYRHHIKLIHPLKSGLEQAVRGVLENYRFIGHAEVYNMHDSISRDHRMLKLFARFLVLLNSGCIEELKEFLKTQNIDIEIDGSNTDSPSRPIDLKECVDFCSRYPIIPSFGSGSTGRTSYIPGMGFIYRSRLVKNQHTDFLKKHFSIPHFVSETISNYKKKKETASPEADAGSPEMHEIISMGKASDLRPTEIGDETTVKPISIIRAWRYLNPAFKNVLYILLGFIPAYLTVGWAYAFLWFGITFTRNAITDIISGRGYRPKEWHVKNIDFDNLSHSLFWTGFSVPLLAFVKNQFDLLYPFQKAGFLFEFIKFFFICIINGIYLSSHNMLRGFDKPTIRANFFRSVLAWPFAAVFAPLGNLMQIPSIVQAKMWSDFVAGLIEGSSKFNRRFRLRKRDLESLLPNIRSNKPLEKRIALLDLLYFFSKDPRTRNSLRYILFKIPTLRFRLWTLLGFGKKVVPLDFNDYHMLRDWFSESSNFFVLEDFILEHYKGEQAIFLTDVVSETFHDFRKWLEKNEPKNEPKNELKK